MDQGCERNRETILKETIADSLTLNWLKREVRYEINLLNHHFGVVGSLLSSCGSYVIHARREWTIKLNYTI